MRLILAPALTGVSAALFIATALPNLSSLRLAGADVLLMIALVSVTEWPSVVHRRAA